jgi:hypothetical protein
MTVSRATLSVLIPNYNHGRLLAESLPAVFSQSRPPDEVIVVDDASTDDSIEIISEFARREPRIRAFRNERNLGTVATLNRALDCAQCDYVYGGAADDHIKPGFFEAVLGLLDQHPQAGLGFTELVCFDDESGAVFDCPLALASTRCYLDPDALARAMAANARPGRSVTVPGNSAIWKRSEFLRAGAYRPELRWHADWFALQVVALRNGACYVPEPLACARMDWTSYSQAGIRDRKRQHEVLARLLALVTSPEFADVRPRFQAGRLFSQFAPEVLHLVVGDRRFANRDAALLVENSLVAQLPVLLRHANPAVRAGSIALVGELGERARSCAPALFRVSGDPAPVGDEARRALARIGGEPPGQLKQRADAIALSLRKAGQSIKRPLRKALGLAYRALNRRLYTRIEQLESQLARQMIDNREQVARFSREIAELRELASKNECSRAA